MAKVFDPDCRVERDASLIIKRPHFFKLHTYQEQVKHNQGSLNPYKPTRKRPRLFLRTALLVDSPAKNSDSMSNSVYSPFPTIPL
jgi:hypothetical protein